MFTVRFPTPGCAWPAALRRMRPATRARWYAETSDALMRNSGVSPKNKRKGFSRSRSSCAVRSETCGTRSSTNRSAASPKGTRAKSRPALEFLEFLEFRDSHRFTETPGEFRGEFREFDGSHRVT